MTLNHFVDFALPHHNLVISNWDAYAMQVNDSTMSTFDLTGDEVKVVVMERTPGAGSSDQGGDARFMNRFALRGVSGPFDGAEAMRTALAHQNPLHTVALPRNQAGALRSPSAGLSTTDSPDVVVTALKPAEDDDAGFVVRLWELGGTEAAVHLDASALHPARALEDVAHRDRSFPRSHGQRSRLRARQAQRDRDLPFHHRGRPGPRPPSDVAGFPALKRIDTSELRPSSAARLRPLRGSLERSSQDVQCFKGFDEALINPHQCTPM